jgi:RimJ/RimL family protein N-acetyltransferase
VGHDPPPGLVLRAQQESDAGAAAALQREVDDAAVVSEAGWLAQRRRVSPRHRWLGLTAELGGEVVALGQAGLHTATTTPGAAWLRLDVTASKRGRGIGSALHSALFEHLGEIGALQVTTFVRWTDDGERWASARGWRRMLTAPVIALDPRAAPAQSPPSGFACVSTGEFGSLQPIFELTRSTIADEPGPVPNDDLRYEDWLDEWEDPDLDHDASTLVVHDDVPVAFAYIRIAGDQAQHAGTATLPEYRGRGLATAAKCRALRAAAAKGVTRITTSNAEENEAMRAINRKLGFEPIGEHVILGRDVAG